MNGPLLNHTLVGGWFTNPFEKIGAFVKLDLNIFFQGSG